MSPSCSKIAKSVPIVPSFQLVLWDRIVRVSCFILVSTTFFAGLYVVDFVMSKSKKKKKNLYYREKKRE